MPAHPEVGMKYRQEYYKGEAEDNAEVLSLDEHVDVAFGTFDGALKTKETTPLEPDVVEHKYYVRGIGLVLAKGVSGSSSREELLSYREAVTAQARSATSTTVPRPGCERTDAAPAI